MMIKMLMPPILSLALFLTAFAVYKLISIQMQKRLLQRKEELHGISSGEADMGDDDSTELKKIQEKMKKQSDRKVILLRYLFAADLAVLIVSALILLFYREVSNQYTVLTYKAYGGSSFALAYISLYLIS